MKKPGKLIKLLFVAVILCGLYFLLFTVEYHGTVIDADTGQPIEGAIVVAEWIKVQPWGIAGSHTYTGKVKETLTDKQGKWTMLGPRGDWARKLLFFPYLRSPEITVWKPGYCPSPKTVVLDICKKTTPRTYGRGDTVELERLARRRDRERALPDLTDNDFERDLKKYLELRAQELKYLYGSK
jgi:hypothetical protein